MTTPEGTHPTTGRPPLELAPTAPALEVGISPAATASYNWIAGEAHGGAARYPDAYAFVWYTGGGWYTANSRHGTRRGARGGEDGRAWRQ